MFKLLRKVSREKLLSLPKVSKIMSDPRVVSAVAKGLELQNQVFLHMEDSFKLVEDELMPDPSKKEERREKR